jgi:transposase
MSAMEESMTALYERLGISRETAYVWLRRYRQRGPEDCWN